MPPRDSSSRQEVRVRAIDQLAQIRVLYAKVTGGLSDEELFRVPEGFANHVAWNAAHAMVTQQLLIDIRNAK